MLYFQKAAGALVPTPNPDAEPTALAMAGGPGDAGAPPVNPAIPDVLPAGPSVVPVSPPRTLPAVPDRPIVPAPGGEAPRLDPTAPGYVPPPLPAFGPPGYRTGLQEPAPQPQESTSQKRQDLPKPIDEDPRRRAEATRLPSRQVIFTMYDDVELEKLIIRAVREDIIRLQKQSDGKPPEKPVVPPAADQRLEFPSLADIRNRLSPPGVPYVAKTVNYAPNKVVYEPIYVIHRRLHFEEKNTERYGWDLGFVQPFVSTLYFYKDTLLWPNSLASGIETGFWDTSAGKCLPGSPVPYLLYPPGLTVSGMLFEGGIITGAAFILAPVGAAPAAAAAGR